MPYLIGKQGISYQDTQQTTANSGILWNPRNFLTIVRQVALHYLLLIFFFMSTTSQNELIGIIAKYIIQKWWFLQTKLVVYMCICACVYMYICMRIYNTICNLQDNLQILLLCFNSLQILLLCFSYFVISNLEELQSVQKRPHHMLSFSWVISKKDFLVIVTFRI